jgi:hypothetical protein
VAGAATGAAAGVGAVGALQGGLAAVGFGAQGVVGGECIFNPGLDL